MSNTSPDASLILVIHPQAEATVAGELGGMRLARLPIVVTTPDGAWHQQPDWSVWSRALSAIDAAIPEIAASPAAPLHVFMRGPYSLGLRVGQAIPSSRRLHVHQLSPDPSSHGSYRWEDWGPAGIDPARVRRSPLLQVRPTPERGYEVVRPGARDVILLVQVTREVAGEAPESFAGRDGAPGYPVVVLSAEPPGFAAMSDLDLGQAALDVERCVAEIQRRAQGAATIHLFFVAPLALAIAAGRKLHVAGSLVAWERLQDRGSWRWMPILRLPGGLPQWPQPPGPERAMWRLADLFPPSELRSLFAFTHASLARELPIDTATPSQRRFMEMAIQALVAHPEHLDALATQLRAARPARSPDVEALLKDLRILLGVRPADVGEQEPA